MSYCRPGERGATVYVYRESGGELICEAKGKRFETRKEAEMIDHLMMHRRIGDVVPDEAFDRLLAEQHGIPYETDVQRSLREMKRDMELQRVANRLRGEMGLPPLDPPNIITGYQKR